MALQRPLENMKNDQKWENGENDKKINFFLNGKHAIKNEDLKLMKLTQVSKSRLI